MSGDYKIQIFGLELHDYFAGQALAGIAPLPWSFGGDPQKVRDYAENIAKTAYVIADAMMRERDPETRPEVVGVPSEKEKKNG